MIQLLQAIYYVLYVLQWIVFIDVLLSYFVSPTDRNIVVVFIRRVSRTITAPISKLIGPVRTSQAVFDFSPVIALLIIWILKMIVQMFIIRLAAGL